MSQRQNILAKIQKLLNLADQARGGTQAEMENAMAKATALAREHNIDLATVAEGEVKTGLQVDSVILKTSTKYERPYHNEILGTLRACFGVKTILHAYWTPQAQRVIMHITMVGEKTDLIIAEYCWKFLEQNFPLCWSNYRKEQGIKDSWTSSRSYWVGLGNGIRENNRRAVEAMPSDQRNKYALVLVDKTALIEAKTAEMFPKLRNIRSGMKGMDGSAYQAGVAKGRTIKLNAGIAG